MVSEIHRGPAGWTIAQGIYYIRLYRLCHLDKRLRNHANLKKV